MRKFFVFLLAIMCVFALVPGVENFGSFVYADDAPAQPAISVVIDGTGATKIGEESGVSIYSIMWEKLTKFTVSASGLNDVNLDEFQWFVDYNKKLNAPGSYVSFQTKLALENEVSNNLTFNYDINSYGISSGTSSYPLGFGIYRFRLVYKIGVQSYTLNSDIIEVTPTVIDETPQINYIVIPNPSAELNGFSFSVTNARSYQFCDEGTIRWYVSATIDGEPWTLEEEVYGKKFLFMPTTENEFTVWCVATTDATTFTSQSLTVSSAKTEFNFVIFWIVTASIIGGSFAILIVFAIISTKREKAY